MKGFLLLSRLKQILIVVICVHFCVIMSLVLHHLITRSPPKKRMLVRSISQANHERSSFITTQTVTDKSLYKKTGEIQRKKNPNVNLKKIDAQLPKQAKKEKEKKALPPIAKGGSGRNIAKSLVKELEEVVHELEGSENLMPSLSSSSTIILPNEVANLNFLESEERDLSEYGERLVAFLQTCLVLPEFGDVRVDLKIDSSGRLLSYNIVDAKSKKNEDFLRKRLPELTLPCFNETKNIHAEREFTIVFKSAPAL